MGVEDHRGRFVLASARIAGGERATLRIHGRDPEAKPFGVCLRIFIFDARVAERLGAAATACGGESVFHGA